FSRFLVSRERAVEVAEYAIAIRTLCDPRFTGIGGKRHGAISRLLDRIGCVRAQVDGIEVEKAAQDGQSSPGQGEIWIQFNGTPVIMFGLHVRLVVVIVMLNVQATEISVVRRGVLCRLLGNSF